MKVKLLTIIIGLSIILLVLLLGCGTPSASISLSDDMWAVDSRGYQPPAQTDNTSISPPEKGMEGK